MYLSQSWCPTAGSGVTRLGVDPSPTDLPPLPTFTPTGGVPGLDIRAATALTQLAPSAALPKGQPALGASLTTPGPYNAAAVLPLKVVKKILALEYVEMSELRADVWPEDSTPADTQGPNRRPGRPPVINIRTWLDCFARMAAVLVTRFPHKGPELWAYQATIVNAAHSFDGTTWVAYDRQYRREMLARKDLNWSVPNSRLYNEAFTGRAHTLPRCQHCLSEDHGSAACPQHPNPMLVGWFQPPGLLPAGSPLQGVATNPRSASTSGLTPAYVNEICRSFNAGRCRFSRCRYTHACSDCAGPHPVTSCPRRLAPLPPQGPVRPRSASRPQNASPYPPPVLGRNPAPPASQS